VPVPSTAGVAPEQAVKIRITKIRKWDGLKLCTIILLREFNLPHTIRSYRYQYL
jgi:hypothetical protein